MPRGLFTSAALLGAQPPCARTGAYLLRRAFFIAGGWRKGHGGWRWPHFAPNSHSILGSCDSLHAAPCAHAPFAKCLQDLLGAPELRSPCLPSTPLLGLRSTTRRSGTGARPGPRVLSPPLACSGAAAAAASPPPRVSIEAHGTAPEPPHSRPPHEGSPGARIPIPPSSPALPPPSLPPCTAPAPAPSPSAPADAALLALPESPKRDPHDGVRSSGRECCCSAEAMVAANPAT